MLDRTHAAQRRTTCHAEVDARNASLPAPRRGRLIRHRSPEARRVRARVCVSRYSCTVYAGRRAARATWLIFAAVTRVQVRARCIPAYTVHSSEDSSDG